MSEFRNFSKIKSIKKYIDVKICDKEEKLGVVLWKFFFFFYQTLIAFDNEACFAKRAIRISQLTLFYEIL